MDLRISHDARMSSERPLVTVIVCSEFPTNEGKHRMKTPPSCQRLFRLQGRNLLEYNKDRRLIRAKTTLISLQNESTDNNLIKRTDLRFSYFLPREISKSTQWIHGGFILLNYGKINIEVPEVVTKKK